MNNTILFDLDGTLIDSTDAIVRSFDESFKRLNLPSTNPQNIKRLIGYPLDIMFANLGVKKRLINDAILAYKEHYTKIYLSQTSLIKTAKEAVLLAKKSANLGIVTTKSSLHSVNLLKHLGIMQYFKAVITRDDVKNPKPDAEPILKALSLLKSRANDTFMIGDTPMDLFAAKNAGVKFIGLTCGYGLKSDFEKEGVMSVNLPIEAIKIILNL